MTPELERFSIAIIYPLLFGIHMTLALLALLRHFPSRARWQRIAVHVLTALGFAGIGLSTGVQPFLPKAIMSPLVRLIWVALIVVWTTVFGQNIRVEWQRQRQGRRR
jgi:hypothetical protein